MRYFFIFFIFLFSNNVFSKDINCRFEEVYSNGQTQEGIILVRKNKIRYEYDDEKLFTIFFNNNWSVLQNNSLNFIANDQLDLSLMEKLKDILKQFPNTQSPIYFEEYFISFDFANNKKFYSNIVIKSNNLNMRIYFYDCKFDPINIIYFNSEPYFKFKR